MNESFEELRQKVLYLSQYAWENKIAAKDISQWLDNFTGISDPGHIDRERIHALFLLSQTVYFGQRLIREMLRTMYIDMVRRPIISEIRRSNGGTMDSEVIEPLFDRELKRTRFYGVGNPSESGPHLLYYFRQVNRLTKKLFDDSAGIVQINRSGHSVSVSIREPGIKRYIFIDDLLGSGNQIKTYLAEIISEIRKSSPQSTIHYLCLFGTSSGLAAANSPSLFNGAAQAIFELDKSFMAFNEPNRFFRSSPGDIEKNYALRMAWEYGRRLWVEEPLGYRNGQLLLAMNHNTPDNSLPMLWSEGTSAFPWSPIFRRYDKKY